MEKIYFPHYFIYIFLTSGVKLHIHLLNVVVQFIVFPTLSILICRGRDISKCFSESLGIRDNESRLYLWTCTPREISDQPGHLGWSDQKGHLTNLDSQGSKDFFMRTTKTLLILHDWGG